MEKNEKYCSYLPISDVKFEWDQFLDVYEQNKYLDAFL